MTSCATILTVPSPFSEMSAMHGKSMSGEFYTMASQLSVPAAALASALAATGPVATRSDHTLIVQYVVTESTVAHSLTATTVADSDFTLRDLSPTAMIAQARKRIGGDTSQMLDL
jgi:hypothetical protein